jgi:O-antigen biosynthesis protein WbqP
MADTITTITRADARPIGRRHELLRLRARRNSYEPFKRAADVAGACLLLVILAPAMALFWLLVRATSAGPGIHWSQRVGRHGRLFHMPKFRTMRMGTPLAPREALGEAVDEITLVGRVLRRFALDELPQLVCIMKGEMSFVGPRPLLAQDPTTEARRAFPASLSARPGLSGIAQVSGRNRVSSRRKARLDAFYAGACGPAIDLHIMLRTMVILVTGRGFM